MVPSCGAAAFGIDGDAEEKEVRGAEDWLMGVL
jgi:hypothetical protein